MAYIVIKSKEPNNFTATNTDWINALDYDAPQVQLRAVAPPQTLLSNPIFRCKEPPEKKTFFQGLLNILLIQFGVFRQPAVCGASIHR